MLPLSVDNVSHNSGGLIDMCCPLSVVTVSHNSGVVLWILCAAPYRVTLLVTMVV